MKSKSIKNINIKIILLLLVLALSSTSCVYYNTFFNAEKFFNQAREMQLKRLESSPDTAKLVVDAEKKLYDKSMEKCSKVLHLHHRKKKYVALSTYKLGEIYLWQGRHSYAIRKFNEFLSRFRKHRLADNARYYKALAYTGKKRYRTAQKILNKLIINTGKSIIRKKSIFLLGEISLKQGSSFTALDKFKSLKTGDKIFRSFINFRMGNLFYSQHDYREALKYLKHVEDIIKIPAKYSELRIPSNMKYMADIKIGEIYFKQQRYKKALSWFSVLLDNNMYVNEFPEIYFNIAIAKQKLKKIEDAEKEFLKILDEYPKTISASKAAYHLGLLYEQDFGDLESAFEYYKRSVIEYRNCKEAEEAEKRKNGLFTLLAFNSGDSLLSIDTTFTVRDSGRVDSLSKVPMFLKYYASGEIYLYTIPLIDSAINYFSRIQFIDTLDLMADTTSSLDTNELIEVLEDSSLVKTNIDSALINQKPPSLEIANADTLQTNDSLNNNDSLATKSVRKFKKAKVWTYKELKVLLLEYKMKSALSLAWINSAFKKDTLVAESLFNKLILDFPNTEYAKQAQRMLDIEVSILTAEDSVKLEYRNAELLFDAKNDSASINAFVSFIQKYPKHPLATKATIAAAWIAETQLFNNKMAKDLYYLVYVNDSLDKKDMYRIFAAKKIEGIDEDLTDIEWEKEPQGPEGTFLSQEMQEKIASIKQEKELESESYWVNIKKMNADRGNLVGNRNIEALENEVIPAIDLIEELYIDMIDEGLQDEGILELRISIDRDGEVTRVRPLQNKSTVIKDKAFLSELENIFLGMAFDDSAKENIVILLKIEFENKSKKLLYDTGEESDWEED